ncbi:MAG TPA: KTSC domain-containing protein [Bryobacteraceae bacterium]|nr:KTSC domain-containing protein [Bryobacteraceae bacterium]
MGTRTESKSSNVRAIEYDADTSRLTVEFHSGGRYAYDGVTADDHAAFVKAPSHGKHFHAHIKGKYSTSKLN